MAVRGAVLTLASRSPAQAALYSRGPCKSTHIFLPSQWERYSCQRARYLHMLTNFTLFRYSRRICIGPPKNSINPKNPKPPSPKPSGPQAQRLGLRGNLGRMRTSTRSSSLALVVRRMKTATSFRRKKLSPKLPNPRINGRV